MEKLLSVNQPIEVFVLSVIFHRGVCSIEDLPGIRYAIVIRITIAIPGFEALVDLEALFEGALEFITKIVLAARLDNYAIGS